MRFQTWFLSLATATVLACGPAPPGDDPSSSTATCPTFLPAPEGLPDSGEWRTHPSIGDIDEDGLNDVVGLPRKGGGPQAFLSDGLGGWRPGSEGLAYEHGFSCGVGTRLHDVNRDGHLDLVLADHCKGVLVYHGNGDGTWETAGRGIPTNMEGFNDAAVGDLDGDSLPEIVAISAFTRGFLVVTMRPDGTWRVVPDTGLPPTGSGWQVEIEDVNADGRPDVLTTFSPVSTDRRHEPSPPAKVWLQDAGMTFRPATGFSSEGRYFGIASVPRAGSSIPDIVMGVYGYRAGLYLYESEDGEHWSEVARIDDAWFAGVHKGFSGVRVADVNLDGCPDVIANEGTSIHALVGVGNCEREWSLCPPERTVPRLEGDPIGWGLAVGDVNGDGRPDLVSGLGTAAGRLGVWQQVDAETASAWHARQGQGEAVSSAERSPSP